MSPLLNKAVFQSVAIHLDISELDFVPSFTYLDFWLCPSARNLDVAEVESTIPLHRVRIVFRSTSTPRPNRSFFRHDPSVPADQARISLNLQTWKNVLDEPINTETLARKRIDKILTYFVNIASSNDLATLPQFRFFASTFRSFDVEEISLEMQPKRTGESESLNYLLRKRITVLSWAWETLLLTASPSSTSETVCPSYILSAQPMLRLSSERNCISISSVWSSSLFGIGKGGFRTLLDLLLLWPQAGNRRHKPRPSPWLFPPPQYERFGRAITRRRWFVQLDETLWRPWPKNSRTSLPKGMRDMLRIVQEIVPSNWPGPSLVIKRKVQIAVL